MTKNVWPADDGGSRWRRGFCTRFWKGVYRSTPTRRGGRRGGRKRNSAAELVVRRRPRLLTFIVETFGGGATSAVPVSSWGSDLRTSVSWLQIRPRETKSRMVGGGRGGGGWGTWRQRGEEWREFHPPSRIKQKYYIIFWEQNRETGAAHREREAAPDGGSPCRHNIEGADHREREKRVYWEERGMECTGGSAGQLASR